VTIWFSRLFVGHLLRLSSWPRAGLANTDGPRAELAAKTLWRAQKSTPQAPKRGDIFGDLAARLKLGPSQNLAQIRVFPQTAQRQPAKTTSTHLD
jgi:hypothetical protein